MVCLDDAINIRISRDKKERLTEIAELAGTSLAEMTRSMYDQLLRGSD